MLAQQLLYTLARLTNKRMGLTKRMGLARKNEEAAANLQESGEAAASLQGSKELNLQEN